MDQDQFAGLVYREATATGVTLSAGGTNAYYTNDISGYQKMIPVSWRTSPEIHIYALNMNSSGRNINRVDVKNISSSSISNQTIIIGYLCKKTN